MYFRQFCLQNMYFSSYKIPENQESASLTVLNKVLPYAGYTMTRCMEKVFIATYICLCDNLHICCLWLKKDPIWSWGTKENIKLAAWTLFLCDETQPFFAIRCCCQWHEEDLSDILIKDTRWKVMVILYYWTLHTPHSNNTIITTRFMILSSLRQWLLADLHWFWGQNMTSEGQT